MVFGPFVITREMLAWFATLKLEEDYPLSRTARPIACSTVTLLRKQ
jgi:hypothetical protein